MGNSLRQQALDFVRLAHSNPVDASDPALLDRLWKCAVDDMSDGYAALHAPVAPWRAEARVVLPGAQQNGTQRVPITFPWPVVLVGMRPVVRSIRPITAGLTIPDLDDLDVAMDINLQTQLNQSQGAATTGTNNGQSTNFVSLGSIGVQEPVLFGAALKDPKPELGFTFRWTQVPPDPPTAPIWTDVFLKVTVYYFPMFPQESANVAPSMRNAP